MADLRDEDKLFSAINSKGSIGATELNDLFLKNPSGSGKTLNLRQLILSNIHTVDGSWVRARVYVDPTTSANGTSVTTRTLDIGSGKSSTATAFHTPTSSANGGQIFDITAYSGQTTILNFPPGVCIQPNHTIMITLVADGTSRTSTTTLVWDED